MMRIVMVSCDYAPTVGGIAGHIQQLSRALSRRGHYVCVVNHRYGDGEARTWDDHGVLVYQSYLGRENSRWKASLPAYWRSGRTTLAKAIHETTPRGVDGARPLLLHVHDLLEGLGMASPIARRGTPLIFTNHSSTYLSWMRSRAKMAILTFAARGVRSVIAPSRELQEASSRIGKRAHYIPNGVDLTMFAPVLPGSRDAARRSLGFIDRNVVLCPRRLVHKNGVDRIVEALPRIAERLPGVLLVLAGGGPEHETLASRARALNVLERVRFLGDVPYERMVDLYAAADVVVIPSRLEATSLAALEACACALPVVATRVGGLPEVIENDRTGVLVEEDDVAALANAVSTLLADPALRARLGSSASAEIRERFSWDEIALQTEAVYIHAIDNRLPNGS